jgi:hypothetical protein
MSGEKFEVTLSLSKEALELLGVIGTNYVAAGLASDMPVVYSDAIALELSSEIENALVIPGPKP